MARRKNKVSSMLTVLFVLIGAVIFLLFNNGAPAQEENREVSDVSGAMELYVLDVGQADALLIKSEEGNILFDSGDLDTKNELIAELEELGVKKIEYAVFTHPHADHIGAADLVLTTFEVKNVILPVVQMVCADGLCVRLAREVTRIAIGILISSTSRVI